MWWRNWGWLLQKSYGCTNKDRMLKGVLKDNFRLKLQASAPVKTVKRQKNQQQAGRRDRRARHMAQECAKRLWLLFIVHFEQRVCYSKARLVFLLCLCFSQIHTFCCGCTFARQISQEWGIPECWKLADSCRQCCWSWWHIGFRHATVISFICKFHLYGTQFVSVWQYMSLPPPSQIIIYKKNSVSVRHHAQHAF